MKTQQTVRLKELCRVFGRIGVLSFGGPASQIALMHRELVEDRDWLTEESFLRALSLCMLLPGPEAMQLATYAGWRLHGTLGGLIAGLLFVVPGACVIAALALIYAQAGQVPLVQAAFVGIKATVIIIVLQALLKLSHKALKTPGAWALAAGAFCGLFLFDLPFPLVILIAALIGAFVQVSQTRPLPVTPQGPRHPFRVMAIWGTLWAAPLGVIALIDAEFLMQIAVFFSTLAVVTFGGAYAVLAYMTQTVVADYGWLTTAQMIDALGLAETTPGPLILVTQFVAMIAGFAQGGILLALAAGAVSLWVTFIPCFLWIFLAGPYLDHIAARPRLAGALGAITAAVVGVILNLALWFAIHVLFAEVTQIPGWNLPVPLPATLDADALLLTACAGIALIYFRRSLPETLAMSALGGLCLSWI